jgi:glutamate/aspartate transport system substrate-binding protein
MGRVAVIPATPTAKALGEVLRSRLVAATIVPVADHAAGVAALDNGTADAYASDHSILIGIGRTSKSPEKLSLVSDFFSFEPYGLMLRRGDPAFRLSVNRALAGLYRSRGVAPMFEKWFGSMPTAAPLIGAMYIINALPE